MDLLSDPYRIKVCMRTEVLVAASEHAEWADQWMGLASVETVVKSPIAFRGRTCFRGSWLLGVLQRYNRDFTSKYSGHKQNLGPKSCVADPKCKFEGHAYGVFCTGLHNT